MESPTETDVGAGKCWVHFLKDGKGDRERKQEAEQVRRQPSPWPARWDAEIEAVYRYEQGGQLLYEVVRRQGKKFGPRHQVAGRWIQGYGFPNPSEHTTLYQIDQAQAALVAGDTLWITEGEKDAEAIIQAGGVSTTMPGGVGMGFRAHHAESLAKIPSQSRLEIVADVDAAGMKHAVQVRDRLREAGVNSDRVRILRARTGKDPADHLAFGLGLEDFLVIEEEALEAHLPEETAISRAFERTSIAEWFAGDGSSIVPEPRRWIVPDLLPLGIGGLLIAKGGTGKGHFSVALALSLALQEQFGSFPVQEEAGVAIASKEEDIGEIRRRLYFSSVARFGAGYRFSQLQADALRRSFHPVDLLGLRGAQLGEELVAHFSALVARAPTLRLIILDPVGKFLPPEAPELNSQEGAGFIHDWIGRIVRETGCTVLAIHHIRKQSSEGRQQLDSTAATGSQQLVDYARWAMNLMRLDAEGARRYALDVSQGPYILGSVSKTNYTAPLQTPLILRAGDGGGLVPIDVPIVAELDAQRVLDVMTQQGPGVWMERAEMRDLCTELGLTRNETDRGRSSLVQRGLLVTKRARPEKGRGYRTLFALVSADGQAAHPEQDHDGNDDEKQPANWWDT